MNNLVSLHHSIISNQRFSKVDNLYKINFKSNSSNNNVDLNSINYSNNDAFYNAMAEKEAELEKAKRKDNLSWIIGIASGLAIIALAIKGLAKPKAISQNIGSVDNLSDDIKKYNKGFDLSNLDIRNLSNDESIGNLKTTKTLSKKVQEFFVDLLESGDIEEKYIKRAGLNKKGFPNSSLLLGASGTGKTETVKMLAKADGSEFIIIKLGDFANSFVDGTATNMTKMFYSLDEMFKKNSNKKYTVLFDEADGIAKKLENIPSDKDFLSKNRQSFLTGCDLVMPNKNVRFFAATNVPLNEMDDAVITRFGKNIEFDLPNEDQLIEGLKFHLKDCQGLTEGNFDFFKNKASEIRALAKKMVSKKYAFRDLQKMTTDAQSIYAKDMHEKKKDLIFDVKYLKEAMDRKGLNAAELNNKKTPSPQPKVYRPNVFQRFINFVSEKFEK